MVRAAEKGMEYSNGYIFPREDAQAMEQLEAQRLAQALQLSAVQANVPPPDADADGALMAVALQVSTPFSCPPPPFTTRNLLRETGGLG